MAISAAVKRLIQEHIPGFDFTKERAVLEMRSSVRVAQALAKKKIIARKLDELNSRWVCAGVTMQTSMGECEVVRSISSDGHLVFQGRKGSFNPDY